ncbi:MAG TPA: helix-turn-helix domain-containing protein [Patescibacteria group bacterium]|nr:helix-turn-helix domain-containing protein [Patescibacteria group bacterium]
MTTVDLLLHPVRLSILQAFLGGRELTTTQLAAEMGGIPTGRIYRHITLLTYAGVLIVKSEQHVRGAVERTYVLRLRTTIDPVELHTMSPDDHLQVFTAFMASLLACYEQYLAIGKPDLERDGVSYSMNALWLSDNEHTNFLKDVARIVAPRTKLKQTAGRKRRLVASAFMPLPNPKEESND